MPNATHGVTIVARSLALSPGDEILGNDHEYGAAERAWRFIGEERGATYVRRAIPLPITDAAALADHLWAGVTERTRVLFLSHITSPTALTFPVADLCRRARARGIITVIDGAHAPGQIPLDLAALDADYRERARVPLPSGMGVNGAVAAATMYLIACHVCMSCRIITT